MDNSKQFTAIEWCAGYGGIHLGIKRAIPNLRVIAYGEIEAFACANLVSKMEAGLLDSAPIWSDLKTFPSQEFRDRVDLLVAGYPCQPFSAAGKRLGTEDPRHLWPHIAGAIRVIRPRFCFFENVEGHISLGLREVIGELEEIGYQTAWGIFSASEVGAPHQRKRVFILAHSADQRPEWGSILGSPSASEAVERCGAWNGESCESELANTENQHGRHTIGSEKKNTEPALRGQHLWPSSPGELADSQHEHDGGLFREGQLQQQQEGRACGQRVTATSHQAWPSRPGEPQHGWEPPRVVGSVPKKLADFCTRDSQSWGDTSQTGSEGTCERGQGEDAVSNGGSGVCGGDQGNEPQERVVGNAKRIRLESTRDEGAMGEEGSKTSAERCEFASTIEEPSDSTIAECQTQPALGGNPDGTSDWMDYAELYTTCDNRTDELRLLGNGVVPATAERAFRVLMNELMNI